MTYLFVIPSNHQTLHKIGVNPKPDYVNLDDNILSIPDRVTSFKTNFTEIRGITLLLK
jgi:hypothetical protein